MGQTMLDGIDSDELEQATINKIKLVRERVRYILEHYPSTRGNDRELCFRYYRVFEPFVGFRIADFDVLLKMTSMETVVRRRREYNQRGEYLPTEKKVRKRRIISEIPQSKFRTV